MDIIVTKADKHYNRNNEAIHNQSVHKDDHKPITSKPNLNQPKMSKKKAISDLKDAIAIIMTWPLSILACIVPTLILIVVDSKVTMSDHCFFGWVVIVLLLAPIIFWMGSFIRDRLFQKLDK